MMTEAELRSGPARDPLLRLAELEAAAAPLVRRYKTFAAAHPPSEVRRGDVTIVSVADLKALHDAVEGHKA